MNKPQYRWVMEPARRLRVMAVVCDEFDLTQEDLKGVGRTRIISRARMAFSYITRKHFNDTYQRIAIELNSDHSTIIRQLSALDDLMYINDPIKKRIEKIEQELLTKQLI